MKNLPTGERVQLTTQTCRAYRAARRAALKAS